MATNPDYTGSQDGYYSQNAGNPPASAGTDQTASAKSSNTTSQQGKYNFANSSASSEAKNSGGGSGGGGGGGGGGGSGGGYDIGASVSMASADNKVRENNRSDAGTHVLTGSIFDHSMNFGPRTNSGAPVSTGGLSPTVLIVGGLVALAALGALVFAVRR